MSKQSGSKKARAAGIQLAQDQLNSDYFCDWVHDEMLRASRMDPSEVIPLNNKNDARRLAKRMLQQLKWDASRDADPALIPGGDSKAFFEGFRTELEKESTVDCLADEIISIDASIRGNGLEEHPVAANGGGAYEFAELLKSLVNTQGRQLRVAIEHRLGGPAHYYESVYVNFINLPTELGRGGGGGAEAENNRMSFWIHGFNGADQHAPPPKGVVKIEMSNSTLPREYKLRGKTAAPEAIAKYLATFLNKVIAEVPPRFTHTQGFQEGRMMRARGPQPVDDPFYVIQGAYSDGHITDSFGFDDEATAIAEAKKLLRDPMFEGDNVRVITRDGELAWPTDGREHVTRKSMMRDFEAVDPAGNPISGPFKKYSDARKDADRAQGHVRYVPKIDLGTLRPPPMTRPSAGSFGRSRRSLSPSQGPTRPAPPARRR